MRLIFRPTVSPLHKKLYAANSNFPKQIDSIRVTAQNKNLHFMVYKNNYGGIFDFLRCSKSIDHTHCFLFTESTHLKIIFFEKPL